MKKDLDEDLDILGRQPLLNSLYTQVCLCFAVADASSHPAIIDTLTNGLERLSVSFPWISGQVINEAPGEGHPDVFKIRSFEKIPRLVVKDLRHDPTIPMMETLRRASFPSTMLDESIIAPRNTLPGLPGSSDEFETPVFLLQATFITGGLLLTFVGLHSTMDMTGQGQIIHLLSKACRNEPFTKEELSSGNLPRANLVPLLDSTYSPGPELAYQIKPTPPSHNISGGTDDHSALPPPKCAWAYFTFHPAELSALKSLATTTMTSRFISTDDALCAFIWQSVLRARLPRLNTATEVTFARAVDVRRYLDIPHTYPGLMQNMAYHTLPLAQLVSSPLGVVASNLRSAVDPSTSNLIFDTRALATFFDRTPDKSIVSFTATLDLSADIMLSSWSKIDCYDLDFNLGLGKPESVRRPQFTPVESLLYLMPKALDGEIALKICLRDEDMERLRADDEFQKYARYIG